MTPLCDGDPVKCIDFAVLFIVEYMKDWTTIVMLALLLGLLLRLRVDRHKAHEASYARKLGAYDEKRRAADERVPTWTVKKDS